MPLLLTVAGCKQHEFNATCSKKLKVFEVFLTRADQKQAGMMPVEPSATERIPLSQGLRLVFVSS